MAIGYKGVFGEESPPTGLGSSPIPGQTEEGLDQNLFPPLIIDQLNIDEEEVIKTLTKWYNDDSQSQYRIDFLKRCREYHQAYLGFMEATSFPWPDSSNVDLGIIEMAVDNIKARFKMSTIGGKPAFAVVPLSLGAEAVKKDVQELMSSALDQQVDIEKVTDRISQDTVELGNCITKRRWYKERKNVREYLKTIGLDWALGFVRRAGSFDAH